MTQETLKELPKIELHCHLDGSLSRSFIEKRLGRTVRPEELSVSENCTSLNEYLEKFDLPGRCIMDEEGLSGAVYDLLSQMNEENVCYAEIRFAPLLSETKKMDSRKVIEAVISGMERGKKDFGSRRQENIWDPEFVQQILQEQKHCIRCLNLWIFLQRQRRWECHLHSMPENVEIHRMS